MNIALLGPSGVGKGTHVASLTTRFRLRHASTGDLLRHNLQHHTALGILARRHMQQNELVPDELVDAMIEEWGYALPSEEGMLFDGFPRTSPQARFLDEFLANLGRTLDAVIYLHVADDEIVRRLGGRLICSSCQQPYHRTARPPRVAGCCDECGAALYQRPDDAPEIIRTRLRVFHRTTEPLLAHYAASGKLIMVEGAGAIEAIDAELRAVLEDLAAHRARFTTPEELARVALPPARMAPAARHAGSAFDLVLVGGPGSGKGTQAALLATQIKLPHIATGDLFRENLLRATPLGITAKVYMERGELVPDDVTEAMVEERLARPDARPGFILDGFPRSLPQAVALTEMLARANRCVMGVINIDVPDATIVARLSGRLVCRQCQAPYHRAFHPPAKTDVCDRCGGALYQRPDDNPDTIQARLTTFHRQTEPLIDYYARAGVLHRVAGDGSVSDVAAQVVAVARAIASQTPLPAFVETVAG